MILFFDTGIGFGLVRKISDAGYVCMNTNAYPAYDSLVGKGYPNIYTAANEYDLNWLAHKAKKFVYLDNGIKYFHKTAGDIVPGKMEELELDRKKGTEKLKEKGIRVADYSIVYGIGSLIQELESRKYRAVVKVDSYFRGAMETTVIKSADEAMRFANDVLEKFGKYGEVMRFKVEELIDGQLREYGIDMLVEFGKVKKPWLYGIENGKGYVSRVTDKIGVELIERMEAIFTEYNYNCAVSVETIVDDADLGYVTDIAVRWGMPFSLMYAETIENWEELLMGWNDGVAPRFKASYIGARIEEGEAWQLLSGEQLSNSGIFVPRRSMKIGEEEFHVPGEDDVIGMTVSWGETPDEVIENIGKGRWSEGLLDLSL